MSPPPPPLPPRTYDPVAAVLSYLVPGLGQVVQGRVGKGVLFFVCLYGLFFYGMALGQQQNVWLPPSAANAPLADIPVLGQWGGVPRAVYNRLQFLGQFWIGAAAWPAVYQYATFDPAADPEQPRGPAPLFGHYMQYPTEDVLNTLQRNADKEWDLGWVYTVIAGALNVLVIFDALAGPVVRDDRPADAPPPPAAAGSAPPEGRQ